MLYYILNEYWCIRVTTNHYLYIVFMLSDGKKLFSCLLKVRCIANSFLSGKDSNIVDKTIGYKNHFFPIGHHICSKHMTAFQSLLFILNARYSSFHMFFKPPSLLAAYNLKISDQAILGRTSTWTYHTTTYGFSDTGRVDADFTSP